MTVNMTYFNNAFATNTNQLFAGTLLNMNSVTGVTEQGVNKSNGLLYPGAPIIPNLTSTAYSINGNTSAFANGINAPYEPALTASTGTSNTAGTYTVLGFVVRAPQNTSNVPTGDTVGSAQVGDYCDFVRLNSGAIIAVPCSNALASLNLTNPVPQNTPLSWNFTNNTAGKPAYGYLDVGQTGNYLNVWLMSLQKGYIPIKNGSTNQITWQIGNVAVIKLQPNK
jgi:hypothetical protein